jgi:branched-chain amino acid aminotransferase
MLFDGELQSDWPAGLQLVQRALYYADGLFESMRVIDGRAPLLARHWARLHDGLTRLGFDVPANWSADFWAGEIARVAPSQARVRLQVWRAPGGLYAPRDNRPHYLVTAGALERAGFDWPEAGLHVGLCRQVRLPIDAFSALKTLNAPRYVAAAREAAAAGWDDALLLNTRERVCEATASNVFWIRGRTLHTPPLGEGCVAGVLRALVLEHAPRAGLVVREKAATFAAVLGADEVFLTNAVRGLRWVARCADRTFDADRTRRLFDALPDELKS